MGRGGWRRPPPLPLSVCHHAPPGGGGIRLLCLGGRPVRLRPPALLVVQLAARRLAQAPVHIGDQHRLL